MCFSAGASFGAGVILGAVGIASVKKTETFSQTSFAAIPLIFAVQQIAEGFLWLSFSYPAFSIAKEFTTYAFIFIAQIVWPFWVPYSIMKLETNVKRIRIQKIFLGAGIVVSLYMAYCLLSYHVEAKIVGKHIHYAQDYPEKLSSYGGLLYMVATIAPPFFSGVRRMRVLGVSIFVSYLITAIFYENYIVSVWCFFAAVISVCVYAIVKAIPKRIS